MTKPFFGSATIHPLKAGVGKAWKKNCQLTGRGALLSNLFNALLALRNDPDFTGKLRYDEMQCCITVADHPLEENDTHAIMEWLQTNGLMHVTERTARVALGIVAHEHPFHPVRDWLNSLQWDGYPRLSEWLSSYLGAASNEYHRQIGTCFLKAMVARIYEPGCKMDYMPMLEASQGALKSQACAVLGGEYYSDTMPDLGGDHVRAQMHIPGKWLIEIPELASIINSKVSAEKLKAFLTNTEERYTPKFGAHEVRQPRQCVFVGTTNRSVYLGDPTGARRFWPVVCGDIEIQRLAADRPQLFAEAVAEYQRTRRWWPERDFERQHIVPIQEARYEYDEWADPVGDYLQGRPEAGITQILSLALGVPVDRQEIRQQRRIRDILRQLQWHPHKGSGGKRVWKPGP